LCCDFKATGHINRDICILLMVCLFFYCPLVSQAAHLMLFPARFSPLPISAITGTGTGDLLDLVCSELKKFEVWKLVYPNICFLMLFSANDRMLMKYL